MKIKKKTNKVKRDYWKAEEETILKQWADKAQCYQWMHSRCREIYQRKNALFTIPVIIISTVTGTANFAQDRFSDDIKPYVVMSIGTLSIIAGIITTIYQFLKISELNEGHRVASISWCKFNNNLKTELLRHPLDREPPSSMIKHSKEEYDRLIEVSPVITKKVLKRFNNTFKKNEELHKPEIGNKLFPTTIFSMTDDDRKKMINDINNIKEKENPKIDQQKEKFKTIFYNLNNRVPTDTEYNQHLLSYNTKDHLQIEVSSLSNNGDDEADHELSHTDVNEDEEHNMEEDREYEHNMEEEGVGEEDEHIDGDEEENEHNIDGDGEENEHNIEEGETNLDLEDNESNSVSSRVSEV